MTKTPDDRSSPRRALAEREQRRRAARSRHRRQVIIGLAVVGTTVLTLVAVGMDRLLRPGAFPIRELRLEGQFVNLDPGRVHDIIVAELEGNYFSLDLAHIEQVVEALPWARQARVRRSWPNSLKVTIEEQQPVARWGERHWLNREAEIIWLGDDVTIGGLVSLHGPPGIAGELWHRYNEWAPMLRTAGLGLVSIDVDDRYAWTVRVAQTEDRQTADVLLGTDTELHDQRLRRLVSAYAGLKKQTGTVLVMDLRYPNGMAITQDNSDKGDEVALNEVGQ